MIYCGFRINNATVYCGVVYYEWKKAFTRRKLIIITAILLLHSIWTVAESKLLLSIEDLPDPFLQFLGPLDYLSMLIWLIILVVVSPLFSREVDTGMAPILLTSRYGREQVANAKITVALLVTNALCLFYVFITLLSYYFAWGMDFSIPITEGYELELAVNPGIKTFGDIIFIQTLGAVFRINFLALFCLYLSQRLKNSFGTAVIIFLANFALAAVPNFGIPVLGQIINLSPICFTGRAITYKVLFHLGSFAVSPVHIGFVAYAVLIIYLFLRIKSSYQKKR